MKHCICRHWSKGLLVPQQALPHSITPRQDTKNAAIIIHQRRANCLGYHCFLQSGGKHFLSITLLIQDLAFKGTVERDPVAPALFFFLVFLSPLCLQTQIWPPESFFKTHGIWSPRQQEKVNRQESWQEMISTGWRKPPCHIAGLSWQRWGLQRCLKPRRHTDTTFVTTCTFCCLDLCSVSWLT